MPIITRKAVIDKLPLLKQAGVEVPELGGSVIVRGLMLRDRLNITLKRESTGIIAEVLAECVLGADQLPIFTADEWERFGAVHDDAATMLWEKIIDLSSLKKATDATDAIEAQAVVVVEDEAQPDAERAAKND